MKKQAINEIIKKGNVAITAAVVQLKQQLQKSKLEASRSEQKNPRESRLIRRSIARLLTAHTLNNLIKDQS